MPAQWGLGILKSEDDFKILDSIFDSETKKPLKEHVIHLRLRAWEEIQVKKQKQSKINKHGKQPEQKPSDAKLEEDWEHDVRPTSCRFPRLVRDYLNSGVLADLIEKHSPETKREKWTDDHKKLVFIAYSAMELGCTLPPGFQGLLMEKCYYPDLSPVGYHQIYRACMEYIDGKPFSFASIDTRAIEKAMLTEQGKSMNSRIGRYTQRQIPIPPGLEPIPSQEAAAATEQPAHERRKVEAEASTPLPVEQFTLRFPPDTCANCGATQGYGTPELRRCKGCKTTLYCFEGCQKWHLIKHLKDDKCGSGTV